MQLLGIFGGTFDPIHNGHLYIARELLSHLPLQHIEFIPCGDSPPHRNRPEASAKDRLAMLELAIAHEKKLKINPIEINSSEISYTIHTLTALKKQYPNNAFCFILSMDNLNTLNQWHQWEKLLDYCHLIAVQRANYSVSEALWLQTLLKKHRTTNINDLAHFTSGKILLTDITPPDYHATDIRQAVKIGDIDLLQKALPKSVLEYVMQCRLYQK